MTTSTYTAYQQVVEQFARYVEQHGQNDAPIALLVWLRRDTVRFENDFDESTKKTLCAAVEKHIADQQVNRFYVENGGKSQYPSRLLEQLTMLAAAESTVQAFDDET